MVPVHRVPVHRVVCILTLEITSSMNTYHFFLEVTMVKPSLLIFETSIDVKPMIEPYFNVDWHLVSLALTKQSFIVQQSRREGTQ